MKNKVILIDLMQTIVRPPNRDLLLKWCDDHGGSVNINDIQKKMFSLGFPYSFFISNNIEFDDNINQMVDKLIRLDRLEKRYDNKILSDNETNFILKYCEYYCSECTLYDGVKNILLEMKNENYKLILVSNLYFMYSNMRCLKLIKNYFYQINMSCFLNKRKPEKSFYHNISFYENEEIILIGDNWFNDIVYPHLIVNASKMIYICHNENEYNILKYIKENGVKITGKSNNKLGINDNVYKFLISKKLLNNIQVDEDNNIKIKILEKIEIIKEFKECYEYIV